MPLDHSSGAMSEREITIIVLGLLTKLVVSTHIQQVLVEFHIQASSCYFSPILQFGDLDCSVTDRELTPNLVLEIGRNQMLGSSRHTMPDCCMHQRTRGSRAPFYIHQMDQHEHDCLGGERAGERPSSSLLFKALPEIDTLGKNFHRLWASVKVRI